MPKSSAAPEVIQLAEQAMRWWRGDTEEVLDWLRSTGIEVEIMAGHPVLTAANGIACGLWPGIGDPVSIAIQLGFATAGPHWTDVYPNLLREVNRQWKAATRAQPSTV